MSVLDDEDLLLGAAKQIVNGRCVLFDFDGPLCRLFPGRSSGPLADTLRGIVAEHGASGLLPPAALVSIDPQDVLRAVDLARPGSELVAALEARLVEGEIEAALSAPPTRGASPLVRRLAKEGVRIAVTTNNSPEAVDTYLRRMRLRRCFAGHLYGRTDNPRRLKPHPDCLDRALHALGADTQDALMFGDTVTDLAAAEAAGVQFVGYARDADEAKELWEAGAPVVLSRFDHFSAMIPW
ncbi:HAD family hydrolase [Streptomyces sp. NPDC007808]|uniref:HAD family hydrolase n=1 Tax=Streptomyces sp. NPDC007808 TaxID=3364779 RepID=UPI0036C47002